MRSYSGQSKWDLVSLRVSDWHYLPHPSIPSSALLPTPTPDPEYADDWTGANCRLLEPPPPGPPRDVRAERGGSASWMPIPSHPCDRYLPFKRAGACATPRAARRTTAFLEHLYLVFHPHLPPLVQLLSSSRRFGRARPCSWLCFSAFWEPRWWPVSGRCGLFSTVDSAGLCLSLRSGNLGWRIMGEKEG